jgi:hypothetical protein
MGVKDNQLACYQSAKISSSYSGSVKPDYNCRTQTAIPGHVTIDELRIYDKYNKLILWNTLGSVYEVTHSKVGVNGSFNGGGNASFVPGRSGNALIAEPVGGL